MFFFFAKVFNYSYMCLLGVNDQTVDTVGINGFLLTTKCGFFHNLYIKIKSIFYIVGKSTFANNYNDEIYQY